MAGYLWPADNWQATDGSRYTGRRLRQLLGALWAGGTPARPLGARSGVTPGCDPNLVTVTGTTWTVAAHSGVLDVQAAAEAGPYTYSLDAPVAGTLDAADATNPRIDVVYVQADDPLEGDGTAKPDVRVGYLAGTAAATPAPPAIPARSMLLATIRVEAAGGGASTVTPKFPWAAAAGGITPSRDASDVTGVYVGQSRFRLDTLVVEYWDGAEWGPSADVATLITDSAATAGFSYSGLPYAGAFDAGKRVQTALRRVTSTSDGNGLFTYTVPAGATAVLWAHADIDSNGSTCYLAKVRTDLTTLSTVAWQLHNSTNGAILPTTAYIATIRVEYQ